jgi:GDP-L-fucose synthase
MSNVLILGQGLVGTAIGDYLAANPNYNVQTLGKSQLDLRNINILEKHLLSSKPDILILAAGVVGGIEKNIAEPYLLGTENSRIILKKFKFY